MIFLRTMAILIPLLMFGTQEALAKQGHPTTSATQECTPAKHKADSSLPIYDVDIVDTRNVNMLAPQAQSAWRFLARHNDQFDRAAFGALKQIG